MDATDHITIYAVAWLLSAGLMGSAVMTSTVDSLHSLLAGQTTASVTDVTQDFISSLSVAAPPRPPAFSADPAPAAGGPGAASSPAAVVDASDWIRQLPDDLSSDTTGLTPCLLADEQPDPDIEAQVSRCVQLNYN